MKDPLFFEHIRTISKAFPLFSRHVADLIMIREYMPKWIPMRRVSIAR